MKHTSIRLSDNHAEMIAQSGESPTIVIKKALDLYFDIPPETLEPARKLIDEHVRLYHSARDEHAVSTDIKHVVPQDEHASRAQDEHSMSTGPKAIMAYILSELDQGREPMLPDVAAKFNTTTQSLPKTLSPYGIRAQETKRQGVAGRYFTLAMKGQIEEILGKI